MVIEFKNGQRCNKQKKNVGNQVTWYTSCTLRSRGLQHGFCFVVIVTDQAESRVFILKSLSEITFRFFFKLLITDSIIANVTSNWMLAMEYCPGWRKKTVSGENNCSSENVSNEHNTIISCILRVSST